MNILNMTEQELMVKNILALYFEATQYPTVVDEGRMWYGDAYKWCVETGYRFGLSGYVVAGVVAALSPGSRWDRNKLDAVSCLTAASNDEGVEGFKSATYHKLNKEKAYRIARGEHPLCVLGGNKVTAFYLLLVSPYDPDVVCVDGHAVQIALGIEDEAIKKAPSMTAKLYDKVADAYREAAKYINSSAMNDKRITPAQVQAVCWVMQRIKKGVTRPEV